jgi:hypothetical protein
MFIIIVSALMAIVACTFLVGSVEHVNLKNSLPDVYESMRKRLLVHGKTLYQTNYAEPGTGARSTEA